MSQCGKEDFRLDHMTLLLRSLHFLFVTSFMDKFWTDICITENLNSIWPAKPTKWNQGLKFENRIAGKSIQPSHLIKIAWRVFNQIGVKRKNDVPIEFSLYTFRYTVAAKSDEKPHVMALEVFFYVIGKVKTSNALSGCDAAVPSKSWGIITWSICAELGCGDWTVIFWSI